MTPWSGPLLPFLVLAWPLLLAVVSILPRVRDHAVRLLPLGPVPALWLAFQPLGEPTLIPDMLLGVQLGLDPARQLLLGMTATLWIIAGLAAQWGNDARRDAIYAGFWGLTLTGSLGVLLSLDVGTFYVSFAAVSLAAWFLVVEERTTTALRAGRVYIVMAFCGEVALLVGLLIGVSHAGSLEIEAVRNGLATAPNAGVAITFLVIGFGIKAGLLPLHVWLSPAHSAAPVPASAVLSGAIVKAGLVGLLVFLPNGAAGNALLLLGFAGAYGAALWGLSQTNPKAVLAYSTVSQMGLMLALIGGGARELVPYYAVHHGLSKGALFLLVGVMMATATTGARVAVLVAAGFVGASLAGMALTGGMLAKAAVKAPLSDALADAVTLTSVTTTVILTWFLWRMWQGDRPARTGSFWPLRLALPLLAGGGALAVPWLLWEEWKGLPVEAYLSLSTLTDSLLPVAAGLVAGLLLIWRPLPQVGTGDLLLLVEQPLARLAQIPPERKREPREIHLFARLAEVSGRLETRLVRWSVASAVMLALTLAVAFLTR
ncbi:MAG: hypothetical protein JJT81_13155 [Rubellimicrobium sp.]|nr:hypothetical protein [Rubellimicrobium sp.]